MKPGKLPPDDLTREIFSRLGVRRADVLVHAGLGQDSAVVAFGSEAAILSTDPVTGAGSNAGWLAVQIGCNDVAASGGDPVGVLVTLLLAPATAQDDAPRLMDEAHRAATELSVEIIGGHSEVTLGLSRSIVVVTALGRAPRHGFRTAAGARPGDSLLMTKWAGLEGTAILATDFAAPLAARLPAESLERARSLFARISIVPEALAARDHALAMHDTTEGGILGATSEIAEASGIGVVLDLDQVPILPETREIAAAFGIDPFALVSSGALLIASPDPVAVRRAVELRGQPVAEIGRFVHGASRVLRSGVESALWPPERDALWEALEGGIR